jgi:hypothetical protein
MLDSEPGVVSSQIYVSSTGDATHSLVATSLEEDQSKLCKEPFIIRPRAMLDSRPEAVISF